MSAFINKLWLDQLDVAIIKPFGDLIQRYIKRKRIMVYYIRQKKIHSNTYNRELKIMRIKMGWVRQKIIMTIQVTKVRLSLILMIKIMRMSQVPTPMMRIIRLSKVG